MKKSNLPFILTMCFYGIIGILICGFLFLRGSSNFTKRPAVEAVAIETTSAAASETAPSEPEAPEPSSAETEEPTSDADVSETAETEAETTEAETTEAVKYYKFTTLNRSTRLHIRETASINGKIVSRLKPGSSGYVLELGPTWCLIESGTVKGYAFCEYLELVEITEEEFLNR